MRYEYDILSTAYCTAAPTVVYPRHRRKLGGTGACTSINFIRGNARNNWLTAWWPFFVDMLSAGWCILQDKILHFSLPNAPKHRFAGNKFNFYYGNEVGRAHRLSQTPLDPSVFRRRFAHTAPRWEPLAPSIIQPLSLSPRYFYKLIRRPTPCCIRLLKDNQLLSRRRYLYGRYCKSVSVML